MKTNHNFLFLAALLAISSTASATTVFPPTFEQMVDQAELIFKGEVTNVKCEWVGEGAQRHIMSYITFKVDDALKGAPGASYTIRMLGGTVDGESMGVSDAPKFRVGDRDILFVENNGSQFIPLVGIMYGRLHVRMDEAGRELVTDNQDLPVKNLARIGRADSLELPNEAPLTVADVKAAVQARLAANNSAK
jgi:hypothetical protein